MRISKEFKFEMAHKLSESYTCKCQNIHGHSYRARITIEANELNFENVVLDFTKLKEVVEPLVDLLDHSFMIHNVDDTAPELTKMAKEGKFPLLVAMHNPTAEFLASVFANYVWDELKPSHPEIAQVEATIFETATSEATARAKECNMKFSNIKLIDERKSK